jgi:Amt family ammonium transporter
LLWFLFGFSVVFGDSIGGVIGNPLNYVIFNNLFSGCVADQHIPASAYAMFQMMFATITPLLITGAYSGRLSLRASLCFTAIWEVLVYYPVAHWIWGGGWLARLGAEDFAGGIVIHTTAGVASVVCALFLGKRSGFDDARGHFAPSSLPLLTIGGGLLCTGWFGFTAGCVLSVDVGSRTAIAIVNTQLAAAGSAFVWILLTWRRKSPSIADILNGAIAGLAGVTPCAGFVYPVAALEVGLLSGVASFGAVELLRFKWGIDDALDVSAVHGVPGVVGSVAIAFVANAKVGGQDTGLAYGTHALLPFFSLLGVQLLAIFVSGAYAAIVTYAILAAFKPLGLLSAILDESDDEEHRSARYEEISGKSEYNFGEGRPTFWQRNPAAAAPL